MNCEACGKAFIGQTCECGWKAPELAVQEQWIVRRCLCCKRAMIRERVGLAGFPVCKWCATTWEGQLMLRGSK